jgi:hypothetical protein
MERQELLLTSESLLNMMVAHATGDAGDDVEYSRLRKILLESNLEGAIPTIVVTCRSLGQFWGVIKQKFSTYQERRDFLYGEFQSFLDQLERKDSPADTLISNSVQGLDGEFVHAAWRKALHRRDNDPEGAITMARSLLESVCKLILDEAGIDYGDAPDINKLYSLAAEQLNLSPSQHANKDFKRILGGCTSVVEGLGGLRNRLGDSHGKGASWVKPAPRHAELAVNLAGAMATFLLATWEFRKPK